jgi:hypothetical protein
VANIGIAQAAAEAQQRQFELDQQFNQDARYVNQLAGSYQGYAAGQALIGAGRGMAQGGAPGGQGGSAMMAGAELGVGIAMAQQFARAAMPGQPTPGQPPVSPGGGGGAPGGSLVSCPACAKQVPAGKFCAECGSGLAPKKRFCSQCGTEGGSVAKFCSACGTAFAQDA